jgi:hypothetical protein
MAENRKTYAIEYVKGDWDKAQYLADPHVDNLTAAVMGLGAEFWAMRRRVMVLESMLEQKSVLTRASVEAYRPSEAEAIAWNAERDDMIDRVFAVLGRVPEHTGGPNPTGRVEPLGRKPKA